MRPLRRKSSRFLSRGALEASVRVRVAGVQRIAHPLQHLVVELQPAKQHGELLLQQLLAREGESAEKARGNMSHDGMLALAAVFLAGGAVVNLFITIRLSRSVSALLEIRRSIAMIPDVQSVGNKR
jgi:hypothetical protein